MRRVRRVDEADALAAAEVDRPRRRCSTRGGAVGEVVERHHAAGLAVRGRRLRRDRQPFVHRAAFVGLEMAEGDPAQALGRNDAAKRVAVERKHLAQAGVEHQRLVAEDEELVEGEAGGRGDVRHVGREPIDAVGDFADLGFHGLLLALMGRAPSPRAAVDMDGSHISWYIYVY